MSREVTIVLMLSVNFLKVIMLTFFFLHTEEDEEEGRGGEGGM